MDLNPSVKAYLEQQGSAEDPLPWTLDISTQRKNHREQLSLSEEEMADVHSIEDVLVKTEEHSIRLRIYRATADSKLPLLFFIHGGGWCLGDMEAYDPLCRRLTAESGCVMVSVDYRRAPENTYPAALDDVTEAAKWCFENLEYLEADPERSFIGGDSSGGNLAAAYCIKARNGHLPVFKFQILIYPVTEHFSAGKSSYDLYGAGFGLDREYMEYFWNSYAPAGNDLNDSLLCPGKASNLSGLPPALVLTAGCDPLHDEGSGYAKRMAEAGVDVQQIDYKGFIHGFMSIPELDAAHDAVFQVKEYMEKIRA